MSEKNQVQNKVLSIRVSAEETEQLDAVRQAMHGLGLNLSRHAAAQAVFRRGLADLERQAAHLPEGVTL